MKSVFLNIVQPIATIHAEDGTLKAIRVFKAKLECEDRDIVPSFLKGKTCIFYSDLYCVHLLNCSEQKVIEVSMQDISKDRRLRGMLTCKPGTMEEDKSATILGTFAMPAIKADGTVVNPNIYQAIGSIETGNMGVRIEDAFFIDYAGNTYTEKQLIDKVPTMRKFVRAVVQGHAVKDIYKEYELIMNNEKTQGIGNVVAMGDWRPSACMSYTATNYAVQRYAAAMSAAILSQDIPAEQRTQMYNKQMQRNVMTYWLYGQDIATAPVVQVPYGFESVIITADKIASLKTLMLSRGTACLEAQIAAVPKVVAEAPLFAYAVRAEQSEQSDTALPVIQGIAGVPLRTQFIYGVKQQKYVNTPISLINKIYDASHVTVDLGTQWCSTITLPLTKETVFCMPVNTEQMGIMLLPVQAKMLPEYRGKYTAVMWLKLTPEKVQNILLKLQGNKKSELQCVFSYDEPDAWRSHEELIQQQKQLAQRQGTPQPKMVTIAASSTTQKMNIVLAESMSLRVMNEAVLAGVHITYSHCISEWQDVSSVAFAEGVNTLAIHVGSCDSAKHNITVPYIENKLVILLSDVDVAQAHGTNAEQKLLTLVRSAANAFDIGIA